jgi:hypothetical protein
MNPPPGLVLPVELAMHAVSVGTKATEKAVAKYIASKDA